MMAGARLKLSGCAGMTRMGTGFVMVENLFRGHPPGEHPAPQSLLYPVIREIRGSNCCFQV